MTIPMHSTVIEQADGSRLHLIFNNGGTFACAAQDHGPFCRLCQPVSRTTELLITLIIDGCLICRSGVDGELEFKLTEKGEQRVKELGIDGSVS